MNSHNKKILSLVFDINDVAQILKDVKTAQEQLSVTVQPGRCLDCNRKISHNKKYCLNCAIKNGSEHEFIRGPHAKSNLPTSTVDSFEQSHETNDTYEEKA